MKKIFLILASCFVMASCTDDSLDPLQTSKITKGSYLTLRGDAFDFLLENGYVGDLTVDNASTEKVVFASDFLASDLTTLGKVEVFSKWKTGARKSLGSFDGSKWVIGADSKYPRGTISIPMAQILTTLGVTAAQVNAEIAKNNAEEIPTFLNLEVDITLKDGTLIPSSSIVNQGLFASETFFPAHQIQYLLQ